MRASYFTSIILAPLLTSALIVPHRPDTVAASTSHTGKISIKGSEHNIPAAQRQRRQETRAAAAPQKETPAAAPTGTGGGTGDATPPKSPAQASGSTKVTATVTVASKTDSTTNEKSTQEPSASASASASASHSASTSTTASIYSKPAKPTSINTNHTLSQGSDIPVECNQGCANTYALIGQCNSDGSSCVRLCDYLVYTETVQCLNCLISYSTPGVNATYLGNMLDNIDRLCEGTTAKVQSTGLVTASPTATGGITKFDTAIAQTEAPTMTNQGRFVQQSMGAGYVNEVRAGSMALVGVGGLLGLLLA